jgi:hypothetical protein
MHQKKRGLFNFLGHTSQSRFRSMDADNEGFYNQKISQLEEEQSCLIKLSPEQMFTVKSTLKSGN